MAIHNRAFSGQRRHGIVEDVADLKRVALDADHQPRRQRRPAADIDVASDGHDWRNLPELFKKLRRACITERPTASAERPTPTARRPTDSSH